MFEPGDQGGGVAAVEHQVGGVGDGQNEAGGVGDHGAAEEVGQWVDPGLASNGQHGWSEHHGGGVVAEEDGDQRAQQIEVQEEARGRAFGAAQSPVCQPVEDAELASQF